MHVLTREVLTMLKRSVLAALLAALILPLVARAAEYHEFPKVVELRGSGEEIGQAYAKELGDEVKLLHENYLKRWFKDEGLHRQALGAAFLFRSFLPKEQKDEINALAAGTGLDAGDVMLGNCFLDLMPVTACSTVTLPAEASPDGVARFGRNLDFPALNIADKHSVILIFHPQGKYAFAAVSWPGMIGVLSGMNEHGLTLANMEVKRPMGLPHALPYTLLYREVLENCKTVDEAITYLNKADRQTANNLMLMDAAGHRVVCEITPEKVTVRPGLAAQALISTNHQRGANQDESGLCDRYDYLHDHSKEAFGSLGVKEIEQMLAHVAQGDMTLQSMVFEPSNRVLYLALGADAPKHEYDRIDLKRYFDIAPAAEHWAPLWDGKTLAGWHKIGQGQWKIEDGILIGDHSNAKEDFGHLVTDKTFKDFTIRVVFKADQGNSGVYFRIAEKGFSGVTGYQAEIDATKDIGGLYETNGRSWVVQPKPEDVKKYFKEGDWNTMVVSAHGDRIKVTVNGTTTADINDPKCSKDGHIALQMHGGQSMRVEFKSVELLEE